jgi:hypothetical protein
MTIETGHVGQTVEIAGVGATGAPCVVTGTIKAVQEGWAAVEVGAGIRQIKTGHPTILGIGAEVA